MNEPVRTELIIRGVNLFIPLRLEAIPRGLVSQEGPVQDLEWNLVLEGGALQLIARLNGANYRRMLKTIDENNSNVAVVLRGKLRVSNPGEPLILESAGFDVRVKKSPPFGKGAGSSPHRRDSSSASSRGGFSGPSDRSSEDRPPLPGTAIPGRRVFVPSPKGRRRRDD